MILQVGRFARQVAQMAAIAALGAAIAGATCGEALAQAGPVQPPQTYNPIDGNGVNLLSGSMTTKTPMIHIGPNGGGLSYYQSYDSGSQTPWTDNVKGMVASSTTTNDPWYTVTLLGQAFPFKRSGNTFTPVEDNTATLVMNGAELTLTLADGTVATYSTSLSEGLAGVVNNIGSVTKVIYPNRRQIDFHYYQTIWNGINVSRLQSMTSNDGYQLHFDYVVDDPGTSINAVDYRWYVVSKATTFNNTIDSCAVVAFSCSYTRTWPSLTFSGSGTSVTDALNRTTTYQYGAGGMTGIRRPGRSSGWDVTVSYNGETQIVESVTTGWGTYTYAIPDAYKAGFPASPTQTTINSATTVTDPLGHTRTITSRSILVDLPTHHRVTRLRSVVNGVGKSTIYGFDTQTFRLSSITPPEGNSISYGYDARGNIISVTKTPKPSIGGATLSMSATYPTSCSATATDETNIRVCNQPKTVTDYRGATTTFTYYATHGGVETVTSPAPKVGAAQPQTRTSYTALYAFYKKNGSALVAVADTPIYLQTSTSQCRTGTSCSGASNELVEEMVYSRSTSGLSTNLQPDTVRRKAGDGSKLAATSFVYTAGGDVQDVTDPLGRQSHSEYDAMRQKLGSVSPDPDGGGSLLPRAQYITYDADGQVTSVKTGTVSAWNSSPAGLTVLKDEQTHYDALGRKDQTRLVVGGNIQALTEYSYDGANRLLCTAVRMNKAVFSATPVDACTDRTAGPDGRDRITKNDYDAADRLTMSTSGYGLPGVAGADPIADRTTAYTDNGKVLSETDGENNKTLYVYDGFDRLQKVTYPSTTKGSLAQNSADYESYDYDENDNRIYWRRRESQSSTERSISTTYDKLNRPMTKTVATSADVAGTSYAYDYDNFGDMTSASEGGRSITMDYDVHRRLLSETGGVGVLSYEYDAADRRTKLTWPDSAYVTYEYDNTDALTAIRRAGSQAAADKIAGFAHDDLGRRISISRGDTAASTSYGYDAANLLLSSIGQAPTSAGDAVTYSFAYNAAGQIKTQTINNTAYVWNGAYAVNRPYAIDGLNRVKDAGVKPAPQTTAPGYVTYDYDGRGNLKCVGSKADVAACAAPTITYQYDSENRLRGVLNGPSLIYDPLGRLYQSTNSANTVTRYVYDGANLIGEYSASSNVPLRRYVFGAGVDEPLARYTGGGTTPEWLLADHQGSIIATLNSSGAVTAKNTYDEYGVPGSGNLGLFQYTGQVYLSDLSLYHYKARAYSPTLGRFLQTDPTGYDDGLNWYAYVGNDPLNMRDPTGLAQCDDCVDELVVNGRKNDDKCYFFCGFSPSIKLPTVRQLVGRVMFWGHKVDYCSNGDEDGGVASALTATANAHDVASGYGEEILRASKADRSAKMFSGAMSPLSKALGFAGDAATISAKARAGKGLIRGGAEFAGSKLTTAGATALGAAAGPLTGAAAGAAADQSGVPDYVGEKAGDVACGGR